jgi:hypothetical protein
MKSATIYHYNDSLLFVTNKRFKDGLVRKTSEIVIYNQDECLTTLTNGLIKCFSNFETGVELEPNSSKAFKDEICRTVNLRNYNEFLKGSNMIEFADLGNEIKFQPLKSSIKLKGYKSYKGIIRTHNKEEIQSDLIMKEILELFEEMRNEESHPA